ncbi:hypothetical protein [Microvirga sp. KLBC 81]|uniref:hypothetical protein n=1 Tax=Microvirga sp. KLBC 81 TaxID=1862707 RepID=UPI001057C400|nr:hypothetical protein [Microvirga sp. KLBC 81]
MSTQPNILDADRLTTYTPNNAVGPFDVGFPIFDSTGADLSVTLDGIEQTGNWSLTTAPFSGYWGAPNTYTGTITFTAPVTGMLVIEGNRSPRRISQYAEGRGLPARDQNTELNILTAGVREIWQRLKRTLTAPASDAPIDMTLPGKAARANRVLEFDAQGRPITTRGFADVEALTNEAKGARDAAQSYAGETLGYRNQAEGHKNAAQAAELSAAAYATAVGAQIFDFSLDSDLALNIYDWSA